ncbi:uncharacterized protein PAC_02106 [Phialocephala subalpina]|uniref:2EXR domain-containing protein n=1 Tax=Phialocephala subalpina TaxID=576137 RepID=A0A1L7WHH7_9HELO|nr:uncharacterized protein PAC_02106 [Phialocephala subalpina]
MAWIRKPRHDRFVEDGYFPMVEQCATEIVDVWIKGLEKVALVIGNDDDMAEVNLVPIETTPEQETDRFKQARLAARQLHQAVRKLHVDNFPKSGQPPVIELMAVERNLLQKFTRFPQLPVELQTRVWDYAITVPRIIELEGVGGRGREDTTVMKRQVPSLLHVSSTARVLAMKQMSVLKEKKGPSLAYYNPHLDIVLLAERDNRALFSE